MFLYTCLCLFYLHITLKKIAYAISFLFLSLGYHLTHRIVGAIGATVTLTNRFAFAVLHS